MDMNDFAGAQPPGWLRILGLVGLLWNLIGVYFYLGRVGVVGDGPVADMASSGETWMTAAFAISVFGGALGCVGLLMLKSWSRILLLLSLVAIFAQDYAVLKSVGMNVNILMMPVLVTLIGIVLAWVSHMGVKNGWLR
jgi:hypothetical protein